MKALGIVIIVVGAAVALIQSLVVGCVLVALGAIICLLTGNGGAAPSDPEGARKMDMSKLSTIPKEVVEEPEVDWRGNLRIRRRERKLDEETER